MLKGNLEYIISSLPNLSFSNAEALQHEVKSLFQKYATKSEDVQDLISILNEEASKYLNSKEFERFQNFNLNNSHEIKFRKSKTDVVSEFSKFMYQFKSELKTFRLSRKSEESSVKISYELLGDVPENPLDAEVYILQLQWQQLEELSIEHYADVSALIIYKLKLQVLQRWWNFNEDIGFKVFQNSLKVA